MFDLKGAVGRDAAWDLGTESASAKHLLISGDFDKDNRMFISSCIEVALDNLATRIERHRSFC